MDADTLSLSRTLAMLDKNLKNSETVCEILVGQLARRRREVNDARQKLATMMKAPNGPLGYSPGEIIPAQPNRMAGLLRSG